MKRTLFFALCLLFALQSPAVLAVEPDEILSDPVLEERARDLSQGLRCLVCRNESIDESHADLAKDLRLLVRERLLAGDSDAEVLDFVVDRYGEFVLLRPTALGSNLVLWLAGPIMLLLAFGISLIYVRRRGHKPNPESLSAEETARLDAILKD